MTMDKLSTCFIIATGGMKTACIVRGILGELPQPVTKENGTPMYRWNIDTKYYSTSVTLCCIESASCCPQAEVPEAVIIYFDSSQSNGLKETEQWVRLCEEAEIKILVCGRCSAENSEGTCTSEAENWCLSNGFELVEMNPEEIVDSECDDFHGAWGMARIVEALQAHSWPDLNLKQDPTSKRTEDSVLENVKTDILEQPEDEDCDGFGKLFEQFCSLKGQAERFQGEERKAYAEKVAMAFWRAIGGSDDEFEEFD